MNKKMLKNIEWSILVYTILLAIIGLLAIFSATVNTNYAEFKKQIIWFLISMPIVIIVTLISYEFAAKCSPILFGGAILLLIVVLFTPEINGASRWFSIGSFLFQPTEIAKICYILFLAYVITKIQTRGRDEINRIRSLGLIFLIISVPIVLIALEPDYGNVMLYLIIAIIMIFIAGIKARYLVTALLSVAVLVPVLYFTILPTHAKSRIDVFLNPGIDPRGKGYNVIQSKLAIGAGQLLGMGLLKGNQTQLGYLYPKTTDFIYAVIGEEMGFVGAGTVIILNVFLCVKAIYVAKTAKDTLGSYIACRNCSNLYLSYGGEYRNGNGNFTDYRNTAFIYKLWGQFAFNQLYCNWFTA